jgi:putative PIN family toxin of toxin-antitoxin system
MTIHRVVAIHRVIFDTSTLVSAALREGSIPDQALLLALRCCDLCASVATLAELKEVLAREKFRHYLTDGARERFVRTIEANVRRFTVREEDCLLLDPACRDPKDNKFLALAAEAEAEVLVSSDTDLLVLDPWRGVRVVRPAEFLELVGS